MFFYYINRMEKFRHFWKKKHFSHTTVLVLHPALQLEPEHVELAFKTL